MMRAMETIGFAFQMYVTFGVIAAAIVVYSIDRVPMEITSLCVIGILLVFFHFFPVTNEVGDNLLGAVQLLAGLANPALIAILALLVIGQGLFQTGALETATRALAEIGSASPRLTLIATLVLVMLISAFLNNTPVVVMFIPIIAVLAARMDHKASKVMMPLSFICVLGGMTTLIGSSTNLLVAGALERAGFGHIGFFDFTIPGLVLAGVGAIYVLFIAPLLLPDRAGLADEMTSADGRQYIAQLQLTHGHPLVGESARAGLFPALKDITVRMIQRGEHPILPPFENTMLRPGDTLIIAATRGKLTEIFKSQPELLTGLLRDTAEPAEDGNGTTLDTEARSVVLRDLGLAETVVAPGSRMIGRNIEQIGLRSATGCIVLGIQRRSRMIRSQMSDIRLEAGDVLLLFGNRHDIQRLRANRDVLLMEWSTTEFPDLAFASRARLIFAGTVLAAASGVLPIVISALLGAAAMILTGCLNIRQASRAIDRQIFLLVGAALAMGAALEATGGAQFLAHGVVSLLQGASPPVVLSAFFLLVAVMTNILSNNATAVLFTPIGVSTAIELDVDPLVFVYGVIFAANCSFATPMAYQTNLLVMGPGHYKFADFLKAGLPLVILIWAAYSILAPWYYSL